MENFSKYVIKFLGLFFLKLIQLHLKSLNTVRHCISVHCRGRRRPTFLWSVESVSLCVFSWTAGCLYVLSSKSVKPTSKRCWWIALPWENYQHHHYQPVHNVMMLQIQQKRTTNLLNWGNVSLAHWLCCLGPHFSGQGFESSPVSYHYSHIYLNNLKPLTAAPPRHAYSHVFQNQLSNPPKYNIRSQHRKVIFIRVKLQFHVKNLFWYKKGLVINKTHFQK